MIAKNLNDLLPPEQQKHLATKTPLNRKSTLQSVPANLIAGCTVGILAVFIEVSLAALIFSGEMSKYFGAGLSIMLLGTLIAVVITTWDSAFKIAVCIPQDTTAAIIAIMAGTIIDESLAPDSFETFATIVIVMGLSSILTGALLWLVGHFKLGGMVRFIPYPVIGGFMAGVGWLILTGGFSVLTNGKFSMQLLQPEYLIQWAPALAMALVLLLATRLMTHTMVLPLIVVAALVLYFTVISLSNGGLAAGMDAALSKGWLLGPLPEGALWRPITTDVLVQADWHQVFANSAGMVTIFLIATISFLLNASSLEIVTDSDIDLNRELKSVGRLNIAAATVGSSPCWLYLGLSTLMHRLGANSRIAGFALALIISAAVFFGADMLSSIPKLIAAGFLIFLGLGFLVEWLYDGWFKLPKVDYVLVWIILIFIATFGLLQGVAVGVLIAATLFVISYARTNVIRRTFTRDRYQSFIMRAPEIEKVLKERGKNLYIVELQGFIFFGTAHRLLENIKARINDKTLPKINQLLINFQLVTGFDSSASYSFSRLQQIAEKENITVAFAGANAESRAFLSNKNNDQNHSAPFLEDLNHAVAWFDDLEIEARIRSNSMPKTQSLLEYFHSGLRDSESIVQTTERLHQYTRLLDVNTGTVLLREGQPVDAVYFIDSGEVAVQSDLVDGQTKKLQILSSGTVIGEIGIYGKVTATATVIVSKNTKLYCLTRDDLQKMEQGDPELAILVHRLIATNIGQKLTQAKYSIMN